MRCFPVRLSSIPTPRSRRWSWKLCKRRLSFVQTGKVDKPKAKRVAAVKLSKDEKARNSAALLASLVIPGLEPKS